MTRRALLLAVASMPTLLAADAPVEIYRRATATEIQTGVVEVRSVAGVRLEAPYPCEDPANETYCPQIVEFPRVVRLDFFLEKRRERENEGVREPLGSEILVLRLRPEAAHEFDDVLRRRLSDLSTSAFATPYAGMGPVWDWNVEIAGRSDSGSWGCFRHDDSAIVVRYSTHLDRTKNPPRGALVSSMDPSVLDDDHRPLCRDGRLATEQALPEVVRSDPTPTVLREVSVRAVVVDELLRRPASEDLTPLPAGASHVERDAKPDDSSRLARLTDGSSLEFSQSSRGRYVEVRAGAAAVPWEAVGRNSLLVRVVIETTERTYGISPMSRVIESTTTDLALLPSSPIPENGRPRIAFEPRALLDSIAGELSRADVVDRNALERMFRRPMTLVPTDGWILVLCRDDGSAVYGLPPAPAGVTVTNAGEFCSRVEEQLSK